MDKLQPVINWNIAARERARRAHDKQSERHFQRNIDQLNQQQSD